MLHYNDFMYDYCRLQDCAPRPSVICLVKTWRP